MKRARKLLKAYKILNNRPTYIIAYISGIAIYITLGICLINLILTIILGGNKIMDLSNQLFYLSIVMVLLIIRSIYLSFFEDKRKGTKSNLRELTIHLPLNKKEFILASYMSSLQIFLPAFIFVVILIIFNGITENSMRYQFQLGMMILGFGITYIFISLEKGILTYYYMDPRIRELGYTVLAFIWIGTSYLSDDCFTSLIGKMNHSSRGKHLLDVICSISGVNGMLYIIVLLLIGYFCHMRLPQILERSKRS